MVSNIWGALSRAGDGRLLLSYFGKILFLTLFCVCFQNVVSCVFLQVARVARGSPEAPFCLFVTCYLRVSSLFYTIQKMTKNKEKRDLSQEPFILA